MHKNSAKRATDIWNKASAVVNHPYLSKKQVQSYGLKQYRDTLVVPLADIPRNIWSLQFIDNDGNKRFLSDGKKKGSYYFTISSLENAEKACVCEGYATGATVYECSEVPVIVAFDAGNLKDVIQAICAKYPQLKIIICADNDSYGTVNTGIIKAKEAARGYRAKVIVPKFRDTSIQRISMSYCYWKVRKRSSLL